MRRFQVVTDAFAEAGRAAGVPCVENVRAGFWQVRGASTFD
eukprot:COSAG01_NODE_30322_length_618_cov_0.880539_1_plen_41_part_00